MDHIKISRFFSNSDMGVIYEIHKYQQDDFQYVVASTNRYPETKVKNDVERMNSRYYHTWHTSAQAHINNLNYRGNSVGRFFGLFTDSIK